MYNVAAMCLHSMHVCMYSVVLLFQIYARYYAIYKMLVIFILVNTFYAFSLVAGSQTEWNELQKQQRWISIHDIRKQPRASYHIILFLQKKNVSYAKDKILSYVVEKRGK